MNRRARTAQRKASPAPPFAGESPDIGEPKAIADEGCNRPIEPYPPASSPDPPESEPEDLLPFGPARPDDEGEESGEAPAIVQPSTSEPRRAGAWPGVRILSTAEIMAPMPPTPWLVRPLQLAPGRPALLYGPAGAGKTIIVQSLALAIAAGVPVWERFPTGAGRVLHVDHDQGEGPTRKRYQRLARGHALDLGALGDRLRLLSHPPITLASSQAEAFYRAQCAGVDLCVIDALRGAIANADENDSRVGAYLAICSRVSAATGTCFVVLHHVGKLKDESSDSIQTPRGSSSLLAASGVALLVTGKEDGPKRLRAVRNSESYDGDPMSDLALRFEDGAESEGARSLRVVCEGTTPDDSTERSRDSAIVDYVTANPGANKSAVVTGVGANRENTLQRINALVGAKVLRVEPAGRGVRLFVTDRDAPSEPL